MVSTGRQVDIFRLFTKKVSKFKFVYQDYNSIGVRHLHNKGRRPVNFGLLFDIDGVIVRGRRVLPYAVQAFQHLVDSEGKFRVPTIFVTNAGNTMRHQKAQQLSSWLGIEVAEEQVVMSHSPLRMFKQFHNKHCLVSGQGPVCDIAKGLGFTRVSTIERLRNSFPSLDAVDQSRRCHVPCAFERYFPRVEAVVLFGEPVRWETSLQLILDVLMTDGLPCETPSSLIYPHLPVLACNMDLQWMAEACLPRFGHGAFLVCLENLYKKITGKDVIYTALVGKPSEITYHHAEYCVHQHARHLGPPACGPIKTLYAIGDNINTDIYGANLYNRYIQRRLKLQRKKNESLSAHLARVGIKGAKADVIQEHPLHLEQIEEEVGSCLSVLVQTGVYNEETHRDCCDHSPRDFLPAEAGLKEPTFRADNVLNALRLIFEREQYA